MAIIATERDNLMYIYIDVPAARVRTSSYMRIRTYVTDLCSVVVLTDRALAAYIDEQRIVKLVV